MQRFNNKRFNNILSKVFVILMAMIVLSGFLPMSVFAMTDEEEAIYDKIISEMSPELLAWYGDDIEKIGKFIVNDPDYGRLTGKKPLYGEDSEKNTALPLTSGSDVDSLLAFNKNTLTAQRISLSSYSPLTGRTYYHDSRFDDCLIYYVIDISYSQGKIDFDALATSGLVDGVIIRLGRTGWGTPNMDMDTYFKSNYDGATKAGLPVGAYYFSQAINVTEAKKEADFVLSCLKDKKFQLPIFFDQEFDDNRTGRLYNAKLSKSAATEICMKFCSTLAAAGYDTGVYASQSYFIDNLNAREIAEKYYLWIAHYGVSSVSFAPDYMMWQYSKTGKVPGINGEADCNFLYVRDTVIEATGVSVSQKSANLWEGDTLNLSANVQPADCTESVEWSSSDISVAKVSGGKVTAVSAGKANITVTVGSISASCAVTVVKNEPATENLTLDFNVSFEGSYSNGSQAATLTMTDSKTGEEYSSDIAYKQDGSTASLTLPESTYILSVTKENHIGYLNKSFEAGNDKIPAIITLYGGDIDCSGIIDDADKVLFVGAYRSCAADAWYSASADINGDGFVNLKDAVILADNFGQESVVVE